MPELWPGMVECDRASCVELVAAMAGHAETVRDRLIGELMGDAKFRYAIEATVARHGWPRRFRLR